MGYWFLVLGTIMGVIATIYIIPILNTLEFNGQDNDIVYRLIGIIWPFSFAFIGYHLKNKAKFNLNNNKSKN